MTPEIVLESVCGRCFNETDLTDQVELELIVYSVCYFRFFVLVLVSLLSFVLFLNGIDDILKVAVGNSNWKGINT